MILAQTLKKNDYFATFLLFPTLFIPTYLVTYPNTLHLAKGQAKVKRPTT
jgi:hypothetical protein